MKPEYDFSQGKRGAIAPQKGKTRISIHIDNAILAEFRARAEKAGSGYQTLMNEALRTYLSQVDQPVTERILRHVLRQELPVYLNDAHGRSSDPPEPVKKRAGKRTKG
ncbi:MAG: BrnA antitoxin family protein [Betaproteobacteria bacterium]|mgnify:CR=1 FL=1|nr:BrnA antitoxin family protein [Betaproteobacteria bacterium]